MRVFVFMYQDVFRIIASQIHDSGRVCFLDLSGLTLHHTGELHFCYLRKRDRFELADKAGLI